MAQTWEQAYGFRFFFVPMKSASVDLTQVTLGGLGTGKFINNTTLQSSSATVITAGTGDSFALGVGTKAITNAALASNVVTLTFAAAHGIEVGKRIAVKDLPAPFTSLNGSFVVASVTTTSPFTLTYALTGTNITSAAVSAGVVAPSLLLDGTDAPFRLLGLSNLQPSNSTNKESVIIYDDEAGSYDTPIPVSRTKDWSLEGAMNYSDTAWRAMRFCEEFNVTEKLMVKYAVIGPNNGRQVEYGFAFFENYQPQQAAGTVIKFQVALAGYGKVGLDLL
jgi:hypothetical protein